MPAPPHLTLLEEGSGSAATTAPESARSALASATVTLTLAILGSSVLPLPYAFSRLGVFPGLAISLLVACGNALAGTLLLRCAGSLDKHSFEGLAEEVGGRPWKLATEVCLVLLLYGNLTGDFCLLADMGCLAAVELFPGGAPAWLVAGDGRLLMAGLAVAVVFPLSCLKHLRQLDKAGAVGVVFVAVVAAVFAHSALAAGLPAVASGELPLWHPPAASNVPEAINVLSFAFYLMPMLLPLLREMPAGQLGVDLTCRATQLVTVGVAYVAYVVVGFFAAARYGLATQGDVLVNDWLPGRWDGVMGAVMCVYLSVCMAPMAITLRIQLEGLFVEEGAVLPTARRVALTAVCLLSSLLLALAFPTHAEKMFAVTGATAVCAVCYVLPVAIHLRLYLRDSGWWCCGGGLAAGRRSRGWRPPLSGRRSFSFGSLPALLGGGGGSGGGSDGPDPRWLLGADRCAGGGASAPGFRMAAAFAAPGEGGAAGQPVPAGRRYGWGEGEEEDEERRGGGELAGHKWTDLSLNRWLRGQSYDSMGASVGELAVPSPASPSAASSSLRFGRGPGRGGSADSLCGGEGGEEEGGGGGGGGAPLAPPPWVVADTAPLLLAAVPEAASLVGAAASRAPPSALYPRLADAGTGLAAVPPLLLHLVLPVTLLVLGVASSVSALCLALAALF